MAEGTQAPTSGVHRWLEEFPSTNGMAVTGLLLSVLYVIVSLAADLGGHPLAEATHFAVATFIGALLGVDFARFRTKRRTDHEYVRAQQPAPSPVTVEAPSTVIAPMRREDRIATRDALPPLLPPEPPATGARVRDD